MNLKELSRNLGLSQTTVSRALNGYPEVSDSTRKRVEAAAKAFNYRPNNRAKGLATGRALAIGHVIPVTTRHEMVNPIFGDFIAGAGESYSREGYEMLLTMVADDDELRVYESLWKRRAVDGVVLHSPRMNDPRIPFLADIGMPFAVHGRASGCDRPYTWLDVNNRRAFERATDLLVDLGHRRIALINGPEHMDFAHRRRSGYESSLRRHDLPVDPRLMSSGEMTEVFGYETTRALLKQDNSPTAVICASLISALGARRAIEECGLTMGKDVSVVTHDDDLSYLENGKDVPIFTATRSSVREAGRRLGKLLLHRIANPELPLQQELLEAELMIGNSTGPAPRKD